jgi:hypothetical protein
MRSSSRLNLAAAMAMASIAGLSAAQEAAGPPLRSAGSGNNRRPTPPRMDTEQAREVAAWNAEVDRRKAEKKAAKLARRAA